MACLNCTARVLRIFLHDSLPKASASALPALRRPLPRRLPRTYSTQIRARHQSSLSTTYTPSEPLSDDDYLPFAAPLTAQDQLKPAIEHEPFAAQSHRPPPAPVVEYPEPEVELTGSAQEAADEVSDKTTQDEQTSSPVDELMAERTMAETESSAASPLEELGLLVVGKAKASQRPEKERRAKKVSKTGERQKAAEASVHSSEPRRVNRWNLPPVEEEILLSPESDSKIQRIVSSQKPGELETWKIQKAAIERKLRGTAWNPEKKLSPEAVDGIRALHKQHPDIFTTPKLSELFKVSPEAIRRILKSKWRPNAEEAEDRNLRWEKRGTKIWNKMVNEGSVKTKTAKRREAKEKKEKDHLRERFSRWREPWKGVDGKRGETLPLKLGNNMGNRIL